MALHETFRASVIGFLNVGTAVVFDFGYQHQAVGSEHIETGTAAGDFQTLVQATLAAALPERYTFDKYRFACVGGTHVGEIGFVDVDPAVIGDVGGELLPCEIAISMKRSTGYASRRDRGRLFFGPCVQTYRDVDNPDLVGTNIAELDAVRDLVKAPLTTSGVTLQPVILSGDGTTNGRVIIHAEMAPVFVHHKSRRFRIGV